MSNANFQRAVKTGAAALSLLCLIAAIKPARASSYAELLASPDRPTMDQVQPYLGQILDEPGIPVPSRQRHTTVEQWLQVMLADGPRFIASLEKTFPGATWAFLGRDTQALADLMEAFYSSIGQQGRIRRLGVSKASFRTADASRLVEFLASEGMNLENFAANHPYILVDTVSGGDGRQGKALLNAAYLLHDISGGNPADLVRKLNMIGLVVSTFTGNATPLEDSERILREQEAQYRGIPTKDYARQHKLHYFHDSGNLFNEAGYEHYTYAWNGSYSTLYTDANTGQTRAAKDPRFNLQQRKSILWLQRELWKAVADPTFLKRVQEESKRIGYEFPLSRPDASPTEVTAPRPLTPDDHLIRGAILTDREIQGAATLSPTDLTRLNADVTAYAQAAMTQIPTEPALTRLNHTLAEMVLKYNPSKLGLILWGLMVGQAQYHVLTAEQFKPLFATLMAISSPSNLLMSQLKAAIEQGTAPALTELYQKPEWLAEKRGAETVRRLHRLHATGALSDALLQ